MEFWQALDKTLKKLSLYSLKPKQREAVEAFIKGKRICSSSDWLWKVYSLCYLANLV